MKRFATILALCSLLLFAAYAWGLGEGGITGGGSGTGGTPDDDSVTSAKIVDATIVAADIATGAVATAEILDNTIANADVNSAANIDATKLGTGLVTNTEFNYLDNVTSSIQDQLDAKAPLVSPDLSGTPTAPTAAASTDSTQIATTAYVKDQNYIATGDNAVLNTLQAEIISICTPTDNDCFTENVNTGDLDAAYQAAGRMYFDNTAQCFESRNNDNTVTFSAGCMIKDFSFVVKSPADADDALLFKAVRAMTITQLDCIVDPADTGESISAAIYECDATGDNCADGGISVTADNDGAVDSTITDAAIDANDWVQMVLGAPTGTITFLSCTVRYRE